MPELIQDSRATRPLDGIVRQNVVLMSGLVTGSVIAGATGFMSAVAISAVFSFVTFFAVLVSRFVPRKIVYTLRIIAYAMIAAAFYIPAKLLVDAGLGTEITDGVGVYLPILITNSVIMSKTETRFFHQSCKDMVTELIGYIAGFDIVCLVIGSVRDILTNARIGWLPADLGFTMPALETTFGGFFLVGISAGCFRAGYTRYKNAKNN